MDSRLVAVLLSGLVLHAHAAASDQPGLDRIFAPWSSKASAGCAVGVEQHGKLIALRTFGSASLEQGVPIDPATVFEAGSVSKQFTAIGILILASQERLALTDNIRRYLPEMPDYGTPITINHLLTHTSGLRDWGFLDELAGQGRPVRVTTNKDALDIAARQRSLNHAPGAEYSYTNTGYNLAAIIIERASGLPSAEFYRKFVFEPAGMHSTQWREDYRRVVPNRAAAYRRGADGTYALDMWRESAYGSGGLLTTVEDLLSWNRALASRKFGDFVAEEFVRPGKLTDGRSLSYARGIVVEQRPEGEVMWHPGGTGGYRSYLGRYVYGGLSVALLCNAGEVNGRELGEEVASVFLAHQESRPQVVESKAIAKTRMASAGARNASARAGIFANESTQMPFRLVFREGALRAQDGTELVPVSANRYLLGRTEMAFVGNDQITRTSPDGGVQVYRRVPEPQDEPGLLDSLVGRYYSDEVDAVYRISRNDDRLILQIERHPDFRQVLNPAYADAFTYGTRFGSDAAIICFIRDASGQVSSISLGWTQRVRHLRFERVPPRDD